MWKCHAVIRKEGMIRVSDLDHGTENGKCKVIGKEMLEPAKKRLRFTFVATFKPKGKVRVLQPLNLVHRHAKSKTLTRQNHKQSALPYHCIIMIL